MNKNRLIPALATAAAVVLLPAAFFVGRSSGIKTAEHLLARKNSTPDRVTEAVKTAPIRIGEIRKMVDVYGSVVPAPGGRISLSVTYPCRVTKLLVREGQYVAKGEPLVQVRADPDTRLALMDSRHAVQASLQDFESVKTKYSLKLADKSQLAQARRGYEDAKAQLESLLNRKAGEAQVVRAGVSGTAYEIAVAKGDMLQAGQKLLSIADDSKLEVKLGVQPLQTVNLKTGSKVTLMPVEADVSESYTGHVRALGRTVDRNSRLVEVYVSLPPHCKIPMGSYIHGTLAVATAKGLLVPCPSVLPEKGKHVLFTVRGGRAIRHEVRTGIENGEDILVGGKDLAAGNMVVVQGNYELKDGMPVTIEKTS